MTYQNISPVLIAVLASTVISLILTPLVKIFAEKCGFVDIPKDERRMHSKPIPTVGGLAIYAAFVAVVLLRCSLTKTVIGMLIGATILVILGMVDDKYDLKASFKFLIQIIAAIIPVAMGCVIAGIANPINPVSYLSFGWLSYPITVIWIVALTNAVNFIDGLDGLSVGVCGISCLSLLVIALCVGDFVSAVMVAALLGSCIGFFPYNFNPAKIFMGDTGATFLGFVLACLSVSGCFKMYSMVSFMVPFMVLGVPIFDICFAFIRRAWHHVSPMHADRSHIHHRLIDMGFNQRQSVAILYLIASVLGVFAVLMTATSLQKLFILLTVLVLAILVGVFGLGIGTSKKEAPQSEQAPSSDAEE